MGWESLTTLILIPGFLPSFPDLFTGSLCSVMSSFFSRQATSSVYPGQRGLVVQAASSPTMKMLIVSELPSPFSNGLTILLCGRWVFYASTP